jgi:hypothetical protein
MRAPEPRVVIEIPLEGKAGIRIDARTREDELRLRAWFRAALRRRLPLSDELERWLDDLDVLEEAA